VSLPTCKRSRGAADGSVAPIDSEVFGAGVLAPSSLAVPQDGRHVCAGVGSDQLAIFARDASSGALTPLGTVFDVSGNLVASPDGHNLYATSVAPGQFRPDGFSIFRRDPATGVLSHLETLLRQPGSTARNLASPSAIAFAPDGHDVYVTGGSDSALVAYRVRPRCSAEPLADCRLPTLPQHAPIALAHAASDSAVWRWRSGQATSAADLGDPRSSTDYAFCLHAESAGVWQPLLQLVVPAASTCGRGARPCWRGAGKPAGSAGYVFRDPTLLNGGVAEVHLKPGADGRASIQLRARGPGIGLPALPLAPYDQVVAQLRSGDGSCWSAAYATPALTNSARRFVDDND